MIPQGGIINGTTKSTGTMQQPSRTYRLDQNSGRIVGMTDGIEAVRQAVVKTLQTERYMHLIYSGDQGSELGGLPGRETAFVRAEFGRRLRAALLIDDRISDVRDIQLQMNGDELVARFTVMSAFGQFTVQEGVTSRVRTTNL